MRVFASALDKRIVGFVIPTNFIPMHVAERYGAMPPTTWNEFVFRKYDLRYNTWLYPWTIFIRGGLRSMKVISGTK